MHDQPTTDTDYEWPACVSCRQPLWTSELDRQSCWPCQDRTAQRIAELPTLFRQLNTSAALMREARRPGGSSGSGSKTPPIPPRLDVLALVGPGGVAARLQAIEDSWRQALGWSVEVRTDGDRIFAAWRSNPARDVPAVARFLSNNLLWACSSYESVGQDIEEIRKLHAECTALASGDRRSGKVPIGNCPVRLENGLCWTPLTASTASHRVHCQGCGSRWDTLGEWRELQAAQEAVIEEQCQQQEENAA